MQRFERRSIRLDASGLHGPNRNHSEASMDKENIAVQQKRRWAGVDWGGAAHSVCVVDEDRAPVDQFVVEAELEGLQELAARLESAGGVAGIAIESTCDLVVAYLQSRGFTIYSVNPKLSKNWREGNSVAGVKSDARDGQVLAFELARRHESLHPLAQRDPGAAALASQCRTLRDLVGQRTELLQRLKATLRRYYRGVLPFFSDWGSPVAWRFLKRFPGPEALASARKATLAGFLKSNRIGLSPKWEKRIDNCSTVADWPVPDDRVALEALALATVAQLQALQPHIDKLDESIGNAVKDLPVAKLLASLPGAGERLAPALTAIVLTMEKEGSRLQSLRCVSGVAPVEMQSGKSRHTHIRRRCNKHWRNVLHLFARCSTLSCPWAKAFYELHREMGDSHATALRKLADKWLKIIDRMVEKNEKYDDARYVEALRKSRSPVYKKLCG